jgi:hypothetical protein
VSRVAIEGSDGRAFAVANDCLDCEATHVAIVDLRGLALGTIPAGLFAEMTAVFAAQEDGWQSLLRCPACSVGLYPPRGGA